MNELLEKDTIFEWTKERNQSFNDLKTKFTEAPISAYPSEDTMDQFILDTDASNFGIGGVLSQIQDGQEKVIGYYSKSLNKAERSYCVTRRELLALLRCIQHFKCYLYGRPFKLRTDHGSLRWLKQFKNPEGQLARWLEALSEYDFVIEHRRGRSHLNANSMSRRPCSDKCNYCSKAEQKEKESDIPEMQIQNDHSEKHIRMVNGTIRSKRTQTQICLWRKDTSGIY